MGEQKLFIYYKTNFSEQTKKEIEDFLKSFDIGYWRRYIHVDEDASSKLILIMDGVHRYLLHKHELRH